MAVLKIQKTSLQMIIGDMMLKFSLLLYLQIIGTSGLKDVKISVPATVRAGSSVVRLACDYDLLSAPLYSFKWYKDDQEFYRYVPKDIPPGKTFLVDPPITVNILKSNSHEVYLMHVDQSFTGTYKCEVTDDAPLFHTIIKSSFMAVVDILPDFNAEPVITTKTSNFITSSADADATDDDTNLLSSSSSSVRDNVTNVRAQMNRTHFVRSLICVTPLTNVPANITWIINDEVITKSSASPEVLFSSKPHYEDDQLHRGFKRGISNLRVRADYKDGSALQVRCQVTIGDVYHAIAQHKIKAIALSAIAPVMGPTAPLGLSGDNDLNRVNGAAASSSSMYSAAFGINVVPVLIYNLFVNKFDIIAHICTLNSLHSSRTIIVTK